MQNFEEQEEKIRQKKIIELRNEIIKNKKVPFLEKKKGKIKLFASTMFSGKTTELEKIYYKQKEKKKEILVIKPKIDNKDEMSNYARKNITVYEDENKKNSFSYTIGKITTHDNKVIEAFCVDKLYDILKYAMKFEIILIEEGQFFEKEDLYNFCYYCATNNKKVIVVALNSDCNQKSWKSIKKLYPISLTNNQKTAHCDLCQCNNTVSHINLNQNKKLISIGCEYAKVCIGCYFDAKKYGNI